ncbi:hypothetical protein C0Q70_09308 [Pomacea canaliculata]|uniref:Uncharacterized protein n=2 Tax=Pomacea canaliculata TaxID=400727 RepID=A0A2T7P9E9_POMCA|nr:hypothetical protein C0Q70_09308 [Pomacea canaliculata]
MELFDESIIAMRRLLGWRLQDVVYIPTNTQTHNSLFQNFTHHHRQIHRQMRFADYELYDYFLKRFQEKVNSFGGKFFEEVRVFRSIRKQVESYCRNGTSTWLDIEATEWNERFRVDHNTCFLLEVPEAEFVDYVKYQQLVRIR